MIVISWPVIFPVIASTRFLWLKDINRFDASDDNIAVYRFCGVSFGLINSPLLLGAMFTHHLLKEST